LEIRVPNPTNKVYAYVTNGARLLVSSHPLALEAGIQVPGGTVEPGEDPATAMLREAEEETGLTGLEIVDLLGETVYDLAPDGGVGVAHRRFYHLACPGFPPDEWRHYEHDPSDGSPGPIPFDFFWLDLNGEIPELIAEMGHFLSQLQDRLGPSGRRLCRSGQSR
jgi:8-oxo-dGTP pyrophosphatase MutT (NUDIX family)